MKTTPEEMLIDAARVIRDAFHYDPGHSDLDREQPIHISTTLGAYRTLDYAIALCDAQKPLDELSKRFGKMKDRRTSSVIAAAIHTSMLTAHEMGLILDALSFRISRMADLEPEFEATAADIDEACDNFRAAEDKQNERLYDESKKRKA